MLKDVTVRSLMQLEIFKENLTLMAGKHGVDRPVVFITVQEAPDFVDWLDGGEFVLSTWFAFAQDQQKGVASFQRMAEKIAALAIKVPRFIEEIPKEIIDLADRLEIPVFAVKREAKFREIIKAVSVAIHSYQSSMLYETRNYYNELASIAMQNGSEQKMLQELAKRINLPCFIVETNLEDVISSSEMSPKMKDGILFELGKYLEEKTEFPLMIFRVDNLLVFPCASRNSCHCYLVTQTGNMLSEKALFMCNQLCTFLTIKRQERAEVKQKGIDHLFFNFILNDSLSLDVAAQEFGRLGLDTTGDFQAAILTNDGTADGSRSLELRFFAADFGRRLRSSINRMEADKIIFFIGLGRKDGRKEMKEGVLSLLKKYPNQKLSLGPRVQNLKQLPISYRLAVRCLMISSGNERLIDYTTYSYWLAVLAGSGTHEAFWLSQQYIVPIAENDARENGMLLGTLGVALFESNIHNAAEKLQVHVNSVRYRLKKVRELVGLDFFLPFERSILFIAYLMYRGGNMQ